MKRHYKSILIFLLTVTLLSCSDDYLDVKNRNAITVESYYTKYEHAHQALVAAYDALKGNGLYGYKYPFLSNCLGDEAIFERPIFSEFLFNAAQDDSDYIKFIYGYTYRGIAKANIVLEKVPLINDPRLTDDIKERIIGEAKFLRAMYNFIAHVTFNEPPLIPEVVSDMAELFTNATWPEFLEQIEKDLIGYDDGGKRIKGAIEVLPNDYSYDNLGRATKGAALTLMGKTYLYHEKWDLARKYLKEVIDLGIYELVQPLGNDSIDYVNAYQSNFSSVPLDGSTGQGVYQSDFNSESIFEIIFMDSELENGWLPGWYADGSLYTQYVSVIGFRNISPTKKFAESFVTTPSHVAGIQYDPRKYGTIYSPGDTITNDKTSRYYTPFNPAQHTLINTGYGVRKYVYPLHEGHESPFNAPHNWKLFRYSDVLLMYAEAEYHLNGSTPEALNAVNEVRSRVGLPVLETLTAMEIVNERNWEFGLEGVRYWDLIRWGRIGGEWPKPEEERDFFETGKHEFLPIPQLEITRMQGALRQNPGW